MAPRILLLTQGDDRYWQAVDEVYKPTGDLAGSFPDDDAAIEDAKAFFQCDVEVMDLRMVWPDLSQVAEGLELAKNAAPPPSNDWPEYDSTVRVDPGEEHTRAWSLEVNGRGYLNELATRVVEQLWVVYQGQEYERRFDEPHTVSIGLIPLGHEGETQLIDLTTRQMDELCMAWVNRRREELAALRKRLAKIPVEPTD